MMQKNLEKLAKYLLSMEEKKVIKNEQIEEFAINALRGVNLVTNARTHLDFDTAESSGGTIQLIFHATTRIGNCKAITLTLRTFEHSVNTAKTLTVHDFNKKEVFERRKLCFR